MKKMVTCANCNGAGVNPNTGLLSIASGSAGSKCKECRGKGFKKGKK